MEKSLRIRAESVMALVLLVPVPSLGLLLSMYIFPGTGIGRGLFFLSKIWLLSFPLVWVKFVDKGHFSFSRPEHGGFGMGFTSGILISAIVAGGYFFFGRNLIDAALFRDKLMGIGLGNLRFYIGGAAYWILCNSVLEEYVWRWFVVSRLETLVSSRFAVVLSAAAFTLHHVVALHLYFSWLVVCICTAGIFTGGAIWSLIYVRYRSVWPAYLSHAIVDLAVFVIGYVIMFC